MKKLMIGLVIVAVCGVGVTTWATTNNGEFNNDKKVVNVSPVNNNSNTDSKEIKTEIESYITDKYGSNWAVDLYAKYGEQWDDILEDELELKFGQKNDDIIDDIIETKEREAGLDKDLDHMYDDNDEADDIYDDIDDTYDDIDDNDSDDAYDDDDCDDNDIDDAYDDDCNDNDIDDRL